MTKALLAFAIGWFTLPTAEPAPEPAGAVVCVAWSCHGDARGRWVECSCDAFEVEFPDATEAP